MLKVTVEIYITDERENQIVRESGLKYSNLIKHIDRKITDAFKDEELSAYVKDVKIKSIYDEEDS